MGNPNLFHARLFLIFAVIHVSHRGGRNANHSVEAARAPLRIFWSQEDFAPLDWGGARRKAVTPATSNAVDDAHAAMVLVR